MDIEREVVLSIGILVSKEPDTLRQCLESLSPIREAVPCQLILTDTGCCSQTREIMQEYADVVSEFIWCNDFAAARNENLSHAVGKWYLFMDDDEKFVETDDLIDFFSSGKYLNYDRAYYVIRDYQARDGSIYSESDLPRMAELTPDLHFEGKVHEYFVPGATREYLLSSYAEHYGYVFDTEAERQAHYERNYSILKEMMEEEPDNTILRAQMAQEYLSIRDFDRLCTLGEEGLELLSRLGDKGVDENRGTFWLCRIVSYEGKQDSEREIQVCDEALEDPYITPLCRAFVHWWKAQSCYRRGQFPVAEREILEYLQAQNVLKKDYAQFVRQKRALLVGQCYDPEKIQDAYGILISAGLKQNNASYLKEHLEELHLEREYVNLDERVLEAFLTSFGVMDETELFVRVLCQLRANSSLWERFCQGFVYLMNVGLLGVQQMIDLCEQAGGTDDIEQIIKWKEVEKKLVSDAVAVSTTDTYPWYREEFIAFTESVLTFYRNIYGSDFRERDQLPEPCLAALIIEDGMQCENEREKFVEIIKQCVVIYPILAQAIKKLLTLYLQEPERKERAAKEELKKLRRQLLDQARTLAEEGKNREANLILQQIKTIVPNDLEIAALSLETRIAMVEKEAHRQS